MLFYLHRRQCTMTIAQTKIMGKMFCLIIYLFIIMFCLLSIIIIIEKFVLNYKLGNLLLHVKIVLKK
jgi:hypothetical protein